MTTTPTLENLKRAVAIREQISRLEQELASILGGGAAPRQPAQARQKRKRTMSSEARARIAAAQKARWAKSKGMSAPPANKAKRTFSAEARAKMAEAARRRWAKVKQVAS